MDAYILVQTKPVTAARVSSEIRAFRDVISVSPVEGLYDLIVRVEGRSVHDITESVVAKIQPVPGVIRAIICPVVGLARVRVVDTPRERGFGAEKRPLAAVH